MARFATKRVEKSYKKAKEGYVDLFDYETGQMARIGDMGASIRLIVFNYGRPNRPSLMNVIYCAEDWLDLTTGRERRLVPAGYSEQELEDAYKLRASYPTLIEGATIDVANRTEKGNAVCQNPESGKIYSRRQWGINHPASKSFLHGNAPKTIFEPKKIIAADEFASVSYEVPLGVGINYFGNVRAYITFRLDKAGFTESGAIKNAGKTSAPIAFGRHPSFRIGSDDLSNHVLRMDVTGALDTDDILNPTGDILPLERTIFSEAFNQVELGQHHIDTTFLLGEKRAELMNSNLGYGVEIRANDEFTRMCTVWTNELGKGIKGLNRQHTAIEFLVGTHAAALSLPLKKRFKGKRPSQIIKEIPDDLKQLVLASKEEIAYSRQYRKTFEE
jgi:hypothetical protein